ncbi:hypothetical protein [Pseudomonas entomophila]|uniref:N-acetyltransferase domain-containing protein n=2 Tax=Pseudomonas entomophila TaxID=312306 RepID=Q1IAZ5_PSEE4|nr:hypothetical protein [Pseudomonas entomophila]WMW04053.1 hypothetical protein RAH46_17140 [Pseudomonas entomophila]CAK15171.1 hypothetical protein PSEEN2362 [Pseudomonas entomophila L48]
MDDQLRAQLMGLKQAARGQALLEIERMNRQMASLLEIGEIDTRAISAHEQWLPDPHDFGWERVPRWKTRHVHARALDIALWHEDHLAGMCWATPLDSQEKIMVLYLQRNPDNTLATKGYVAPLCLSAVRYYAWMLGLKWVVIRNPLPQARAAYTQDGFRQVRGVGLAYNLTHGYAAFDQEDLKT